MPSRIDRAFIENLQNFTDALENIVELLKQQQKKGDDAVNHMTSAMDGDKLGRISEDIKKILDISKKVDNRTQEILQEVKAARKQKEAGLFGKIQDKDNKEKIVSGVEVITLIAGGVLAIGLAFQLVGHVDFLSVLALSGGILAVSYAFAEIANIKGLTPKKAVVTGLAVVSMAAAITLSSFVLQSFQPLDPIKMFSLVFVSGALGAALFFVGRAISNLSVKPKDILKYLLLPIILPAIAGGLVMASIILQDMQPVTLDTILSVAMVGIGLGLASLAIVFVAKALGKNMDLKAIAFTVLALPLIAGGIVAASFILQFFQPIQNPAQLLLGSLVIGISILVFTPAVLLLGKLGLKSLLLGSLGVVLVSAAIMASSFILSIGKYDVYPSLKWAFGVGLSIILFTPAVMALGLIAVTGIGAIAIGLGVALVPVVAASIVASSHILSYGKYEKYPSLKWALGTGLSLAAFGAGMVALGIIPFAKRILDRGKDLVLAVAQSIMEASLILANGNYKGGPTEKWAKGIGLSLNAFSQALDASTERSLFKKSVDPEKFALFMRSVATGMIEVAKVLGDYDWNGKYPSKEWAEGVSLSILPFVSAYEAMSKKQSLLGKVFGSKNDKFGKFMVDVAEAMVSVSKKLKGGIWEGGPSQEWSKNVSSALSAFTDSFMGLDKKQVKVIDNFTDSIEKLANSLDRLDMSGIDKLNGLTASITIMSAVDDKKLKEVLGVLDDNKKRLSNVIKVQGPSGTPATRQASPQVSSVPAAIAELGDNTNQEMLEKFDIVLSKFDELLEYVVRSESGKNVNRDDKIQR